jgi:hypothetical protein
MIKNHEPDEGAWIDQELTNDGFQDVRLRRRFRTLLERLWMGIGQTIPFACQDWANTKGAYRFLSNERVSEQEILSGHFQASAERFRATEGPVLVLQDTTTFSYQRERPELIGYTGKTTIKKGKHGLQHPLTQCGILMHSSLAVTAEGLPLGLAPEVRPVMRGRPQVYSDALIQALLTLKQVYRRTYANFIRTVGFLSC